jgi:hypothetical protein
MVDGPTRVGPAVEQLSAQDFWQKFKTEYLRRYPGLAMPGALSTAKKTPKSLVRLTGTVFGRGWEVAFFPGKFLAPESIVGFTTSVRLIPPDRSLTETVPWYYAGPRPHALSRTFLDYDRIIMRYRRREGDLRGALTSDPDFDRRWAVYPSDSAMGEALRDPKFRQMFATSVSAGPRRAESPTVAIFGTEATYSVTVQLRSDVPSILGPMLDQFSALLDQLESLRGLPPARRVPIPVDYLPDEAELLYPVPRVHCPNCGAETHPRFMVRVETEVCDKCGKSLYLLK